MDEEAQHQINACHIAIRELAVEVKMLRSQVNTLECYALTDAIPQKGRAWDLP